ncbi:AbrB/MazE/SpoVT family DNA-binding domain-containing protein [Rhodoblastus acidophilus]|uniref:AbrB/MazE/SpoVT family DNA-binding domain-containing protein n=1 Tax=Rhodoblastus acidophilus TaxID=1074 RepID=A0A6N8DJ85_RHOAC|nr:AbrB/MazE/SpoVT family DNA-binding domain-containing protein [Rhodoblastus acidophilus]MCW2273005.1 antitoxin MazE [Rhodoblastus acidophilus]MTV29906.1 AbrB/MazE/SpoVT family DNA-binding domain-containing protein [Rhodoblastus acidophilus]
MRIARWGNSLAVRLPAALVEALDLKAGEEIEVYVTRSRASNVAQALDRDEVFARLRAFRERLPAGFRFDREEAQQSHTAKHTKT